MLLSAAALNPCRAEMPDSGELRFESRARPRPAFASALVIESSDRDPGSRGHRNAPPDGQSESLLASVLVVDLDSDDSPDVGTGPDTPAPEPGDSAGPPPSGGSGRAPSVRISLGGCLDVWTERQGASAPAAFRSEVSVFGFLGRGVFAGASFGISCASSAAPHEETAMSEIAVGGETFTVETVRRGMLETWGAEYAGILSLGSTAWSSGPISLEMRAFAGVVKGPEGTGPAAGACAGLRMNLGGLEIAVEAGYMAASAGGFRDRISVGLSAGLAF